MYTFCPGDPGPRKFPIVTKLLTSGPTSSTTLYNLSAEKKWKKIFSTDKNTYWFKFVFRNPS